MGKFSWGVRVTQVTYLSEDEYVILSKERRVKSEE